MPEIGIMEGLGEDEDKHQVESTDDSSTTSPSPSPSLEAIDNTHPSYHLHPKRVNVRVRKC